MDLVESLNRQLAGWAAFYQYTDYTATLFGRLDRTVFWKLGYWLARKYRRGFKSLIRDHIRAPEPGQTKHGYFKARIVEVGMGQWRFGVSSPVARAALHGARLRKIRTSCAMRHAAPSSRAMPMSPLL